MIGIIDWRVQRCEEAGVQFHFNTLADSTRVLAEKPDVVIQLFVARAPTMVKAARIEK